jgi:hypothetical protein
LKRGAARRRRDGQSMLPSGAGRGVTRRRSVARRRRVRRRARRAAVASSSTVECVRRSRLQRSSSLPTCRPRSSWRSRSGRNDHGAELPECFAADVDGAAPRDQQQPQRFPPFACLRQRQRVGCERGVRSAGCVQGVVFAAEPPFRPRRAADFEHCLATLGEVARESGAVAAGSLDRPGTSASRVAFSQTKQVSVAAQADHSQGTHEAASHLTSHTRHGENQAGNGPR